MSFVNLLCLISMIHYVNSEGADQPAHLSSLSAFIFEIHIGMNIQLCYHRFSKAIYLDF